MKITVKVDHDENKFYALVEGRECVLDFRPISAEVLEYYHTFVPEELRNRGLAKELVEYALQYARDHNKKIIPSCSYVQSYIGKHPEWSVLVKRKHA